MEKLTYKDSRIYEVRYVFSATGPSYFQLVRTNDNAILAAGSENYIRKELAARHLEDIAIWI